jgi:hypothetical protein
MKATSTVWFIIYMYSKLYLCHLIINTIFFFGQIADWFLGIRKESFLSHVDSNLFHNFRPNNDVNKSTNIISLMNYIYRVQSKIVKSVNLCLWQEKILPNEVCVVQLWQSTSAKISSLVPGNYRHDRKHCTQLEPNTHENIKYWEWKFCKHPNAVSLFIILFNLFSHLYHDYFMIQFSCAS